MKKTTFHSKQKKSVATGPAEPLRLNKYIAHCGICSRREAAELVKKGLVRVNGMVETNPAYEVKKEDSVVYQGKNLKLEGKKVYILLNKPKNIITTLNDEKGRKTVFDLIKDVVSERIFPVGRLDRNTTGLLLLTNDGELAQKLSHPSHKMKKIYHAKLDKKITKRDLESILNGLQLEDGLAQVDQISIVNNNAAEIGIEIHSGKNRIVRRIFEHLGYEVVKLDRVLFAGLTKKNIPRGKFRHLTDKEVIQLKHLQH